MKPTLLFEISHHARPNRTGVEIPHARHDEAKYQAHHSQTKRRVFRVPFSHRLANRDRDPRADKQNQSGDEHAGSDAGKCLALKNPIGEDHKAEKNEDANDKEKRG